jgi:hypothetical protein
MEAIPMAKDWAAHARKLVSEYVHKDMPEEIRLLVTLAKADLHFGPSHAYPSIDEEVAATFPGFETACDKIGAWLDDNAPRELWVDLGCDFVATSAPEGEEMDGEWQEPYLDETIHMEWDDIKRAVVGELAEYV